MDVRFVQLCQCVRGEPAVEHAIRVPAEAIHARSAYHGGARANLQEADQCRRNTPSTARSSAGLISLECATVTLNKGPSSFSCQNVRKSSSAGNFGNRS